jgi:hypothetical protein
MELFYDVGDKSFKTKKDATEALVNEGVFDEYDVVASSGGGYVGVKKEGKKESAEEKPAKKESPKEVNLMTTMKKVRVHRASGDEDNRDVQISVCVNSAKNRRVFYPGEEVELSLAQIAVLRNSVEETKLVIAPDSGIYEAKNPEAMARNHYPGMTLRRDKTTGLINMFKRTPNYLIEEVGA